MKKIVYGVLGVHCFLVMLLCIHHVWTNKKIPSKMVVRTIVQTPLVSSSVVVIKPGGGEKKTVVKPVASSSAAKKPSPAPKSKAKVLSPPSSSPSQEIRKEVFSKSSPLVLPKEISIPKVSFQEEVEGNYGEVLVVFLQNALDLPENGEVKMDLEIDGTGKIIRTDILESKSKKNGEFLKKRLPELALPCFNGFRKSNETFCFTITFKNLESSSSCSF